jgi:hypothetical protein
MNSEPFQNEKKNDPKYEVSQKDANKKGKG